MAKKIETDAQLVRQNTLDVVGKYHHAWRERDLAGILKCYHPEIEYHDFFQSQIFTQDTIEQYIKDSLPSAQLIHHSPIRADGDTAFLEYSIQLNEQQGAASFRSSEFITVKQGLIWRVHEYATLVQGKKHENKEPNLSTLKRLGLSPRQIATMMQDVRDFLDQVAQLTNSELNLQQLANGTGYSRNQLSYLFNQILGRRFLQYVNERRIQYILKQIDQQLEHPSVEHLALDAGFNSVSVFYKYFRQVTGKSPKRYIIEISVRARS